MPFSSIFHIASLCILCPLLNHCCPSIDFSSISQDGADADALLAGADASDAADGGEGRDGSSEAASAGGSTAEVAAEEKGDEAAEADIETGTMAEDPSSSTLSVAYDACDASMVAPEGQPVLEESSTVLVEGGPNVAAVEQPVPKPGAADELVCEIPDSQLDPMFEDERLLTEDWEVSKTEPELTVDMLTPDMITWDMKEAVLTMAKQKLQAKEMHLACWIMHVFASFSNVSYNGREATKTRWTVRICGLLIFWVAIASSVPPF